MNSELKISEFEYTKVDKIEGNYYQEKYKVIEPIYTRGPDAVQWTDEQLDEIRRAQLQAERNQEAWRRELMRPSVNCTAHSAGVDCF